MSNLSTGLIGAVFGIGLGAFGGYQIANNSEADSNTPAVTESRNCALDEGTDTKPANVDLDKLEAEIANKNRLIDEAKTERDALVKSESLLRERLAVALDGPAASSDAASEAEPVELTAEQIEAKRKEIYARLSTAWESKKGRDVLDALHEMETLGPSVYPDLMKEWIKVDDDYKAANTLGIDSYTRRREWGGSTELLKAAITDPSSPVSFRYTAVNILPERAAPQSTASYLSEKLLEERDEHAIMQMAEILATLKDPVAIDPLVQVVRRGFERFYAKRTVVTAMGSFDDPRTIAELKVVIANEQEHQAVRDAASSALLHIAPPYTGLLVTSVSPGSMSANAGIKVGDILTKLNGKPITSTQMMHFSPNKETSFEVYSEGSLKDVSVAPGSMGMDYDFVVAKN
ncbi:MAG: HEAT repeat domain-containing protein [Planctomycetota bacterium]|jgi:hypothetical protein